MLTALLVLVIAGVCLWLVETQIPMSPPIKTVFRVVVVLICIVYLLSLVGIVPPIRLR